MTNNAAVRPKTFGTFGLIATVLTVLAVSPRANAQTSNWLPTAAGTYDWSLFTNWSAGIPDSATATANFTAALAGDQTINLGANRTLSALNIGSTGGTYTLAGAQNLTFDGSNQVNVTAGSLNVFLNMNAITVPIGVAFNNNSTVGALNIGVLGTGTLATDVAAASFITGAGNVAVNSSITGTGLLQKIGAGTLTLNGASTYSGGTQILVGAVNYTNNASFGTGPIAFGTGVVGQAGLAGSPGTSFFHNTTATNTTIANDIVLPAPGVNTTYTITKSSPDGQINFTGTISGGSANAKFFLQSTTAGDATTTYRFAGNNTFTAAQIEIWRGGVVLGHMNGLGNPTNQLVLDGNNNTTLGDLRFEVGGTFPNPVNFIGGGGGGINVNANNVTFAGVMDGSNPFLKLGTGILSTSGTNTYTGPTTVSAGTLRINGNSAAVTGAITVNAGAALGGTGTIGGFVSFQGGSRIAPGASIGTTTVANSVVAIGNPAPNQTVWDVELNGIATNTLATADQANVDRLVLTGAASTLNFQTSAANRVLINLTQLGGTFQNGSPVFYRIATVNTVGNIQTNGETFDPTHFDFATAGFAATTFNVVVDGNHLVVSFVPVPEPATVLGIAALGAAFAGFARRRLRGRMV